jgi:hypothetical protein
VHPEGSTIGGCTTPQFSVSHAVVVVAPQPSVSQDVVVVAPQSSLLLSQAVVVVGQPSSLLQASDVVVVWQSSSRSHDAVVVVVPHCSESQEVVVEHPLSSSRPASSQWLRWNVTGLSVAAAEGERVAATPSSTPPATTAPTAARATADQ